MPPQPPRFLAIAAIVVVLTSFAQHALAADTSAARAEALYNEALALTDANNYAEACPKYAESQKLDPALGTQFNLADCYEHTGKLGSAFTAFEAVQKAASAAGKSNLANRARDRVNALTPKVPRLSIVIASRERSGGSTDDDAVVVRVDGSAVSNEARASLAVDAGEHAIDVSSPGRKPWHQTVEVRDGVAPLRVEVPVLELEPIAKQEVERRPSPTFRIAGAAVAGLGLIGLTVGAISGANALSKRDQARETCGSSDPNTCHDESGVGIWNDAHSAATISTIGFVGGGLLLVTGAALWFAAPSRPVVTGRFDDRGGSVGVSGVF